jgi:hypothetical protein
VDRVSKEEDEVTSPFPEEIEQAKSNPGEWVYRIAGTFGLADAIPPEAIVGAWKVDDQGRIVGEFVANGKYDADRWPAASNGGS